VAEELAALLRARGATTRILQPDEPLGRADGLIHLEPLAFEPPNDTRKTLFARAKEAVEGGATWLIAATGHGGSFGHGVGTSARLPHGGIAGFLKSVAKELPTLRCRSVDLDPDEDPELLAQKLVAELAIDDDHIEVGWEGGVRSTLKLIRAEDEPS